MNKKEQMSKIILHFANKYNGDWDSIYNVIKSKENVDLQKIDNISKHELLNWMTIIDDKYPDNFKTIYMPPLILYYMGNYDYLNENERIVSVWGKFNSEDITKLFSGKELILAFDCNKQNLDIALSKKMSNFNFIIIDKNAPSEDVLEKIKGYKNILYLTELPFKKFSTNIIQTQDFSRLLLGVSFKSIIINPDNDSYKEYLNINDFENRNMNIFNNQTDILFDNGIKTINNIQEMH